LHRKHPTPEQFHEEYGREYSDNGAVYYFESWVDEEEQARTNNWVCRYSFAKEMMSERPEAHNFQIICACTPFAPDENTEVV
jgi:hypothetical protein